MASHRQTLMHILFACVVLYLPVTNGSQLQHDLGRTVRLDVWAVVVGCWVDEVLDGPHVPQPIPREISGYLMSVVDSLWIICDRDGTTGTYYHTSHSNTRGFIRHIINIRELYLLYIQPLCRLYTTSVHIYNLCVYIQSL